MAMNDYITQPERPFARTNRQTIQQRANLLRELGCERPSIAEICCGDCRRQRQIYQQTLQVENYCGLDLSPTIVALNRAADIACVQGDALDAAVMSQFADFDVIFFGPPLSVKCDGHTGLPFQKVTPGFVPFARLMLQELRYDGLLVCIGPNSANMGDIQWVYQQAQTFNAAVGLRLIHYSHATLTGADEATEMRLKYVELWLSASLPDLWETRTSRGA
jgi:hypothetical protein